MEYFPRGNREFKYSVVRLIELVKTRPIIWDSSRAEFRSYSNKERVWKEIYQALDDKYRSMDKRTQADVGMRITAKWRNIRDAFLRSYKKRVHHKKVKKYMYHDQLKFMLRILGTHESVKIPKRRQLSNISDSTTENLTEQSIGCEDTPEDPLVTNIKAEPNDEEPTGYNDPVTSVLKVELEDEEEASEGLKRTSADLEKINEETAPSKVRRIELVSEEDKRQEASHSCSLSENKVNTVREVTNVVSLPPNEDESFFASILSLVRDMNEDEKLDFRLGVLTLIHEARQKRRKPTSNISSTRD